MSFCSTFFDLKKARAAARQRSGEGKQNVYLKQPVTDVYRRLRTFTDVYELLPTFTDFYRRFTDIHGNVPCGLSKALSEICIKIAKIQDVAREAHEPSEARLRG